MFSTVFVVFLRGFLRRPRSARDGAVGTPGRPRPGTCTCHRPGLEHRAGMAEQSHQSGTPHVVTKSTSGGWERARLDACGGSPGEGAERGVDDHLQRQAQDLFLRRRVLDDPEAGVGVESGAAA